MSLAHALTIGGSRSSGQPVRTQNGKYNSYFVIHRILHIKETCDTHKKFHKMIHRMNLIFSLSYGCNIYCEYRKEFTWTCGTR